MLEIKGAKKYFNRHKKNQVCAIDDTTLTLDNNGLVALLGPSGCGKTTLLNSIGGLDKLSKGSIFIDGKKISSRFSYKVDKIRNLNVGYIFQDYKLVEDLSVYDNVSIVLKMIGIKDKNEIKKRVEYVLDKVGMLRYKKRPASMLSGGERQRVGIARAIVKDPDIILADEPTGNLDSKNSLEIMKIIRSIAKDRLVILVTHETDLAKFYATRIIEIRDGKVINDYKNDHVDDLDYRLDNTFYFKDFANHTSMDNDAYDINIYSANKKKLKLDIVINDGNIYIKSNTNDKIEVVDDNSSIEFVNDHYKTIAKEEIDKYKFDFDNIIDKNIKKRYSSILNPITLIINGFKKVFDYSFLKKMLLIGFFLSGMFMMYAVSSIIATKTIEDKEFVSVNRDYLSLVKKGISVDEYNSYEALDGVDYILPGSSLVNFSISYNDYYQTNVSIDSLKGSLASISMISDKDIIYGSMPVDDKYSVVLDIVTIEKLFSKNNAKMSGITKVEDMIGRIISIKNMPDFKIVGIVSKGSPSIYVDSSLFINIIANTSSDDDIWYARSVDSDNSSTEIVDYNLYQDKIELKKGNYPVNDYEVIIPVSYQEQVKINSEINTLVNNKKLKVVGFYDSKYNYSYNFVSPNTIKYNVITTTEDLVVKPKDGDKELVLNEFRDKKLNIYDSYKKSRDDYVKSNREYTNSSLLVAGVILGISLIEIFLMVRSSFLSRVKEVGIYRAIGVKKIDIYNMFFGEIFAITTIASVPGVILMAYILKTLSSIKYLSSMFIINVYGVVITIVFLYVFNLIIGLLPVFNTIRKRPAQILSRYDLD